MFDRTKRVNWMDLHLCKFKFGNPIRAYKSTQKHCMYAYSDIQYPLWMEADDVFNYSYMFIQCRNVRKNVRKSRILVIPDAFVFRMLSLFRNQVWFSMWRDRIFDKEIFCGIFIIWAILYILGCCPRLRPREFSFFINP